MSDPVGYSQRLAAEQQQNVQEAERQWGALSDHVATLSATILGLSAVFIARDQVVQYPPILFVAWSLLGAALALSVVAKWSLALYKGGGVSQRRFAMGACAALMVLGIGFLLVFAAINLTHGESKTPIKQSGTNAAETSPHIVSDIARSRVTFWLSPVE